MNATLVTWRTQGVPPVAGCAECLKVAHGQPQIPALRQGLDVIDVHPCAGLGRCAADQASRIAGENFIPRPLPCRHTVKPVDVFGLPPALAQKDFDGASSSVMSSASIVWIKSTVSADVRVGAQPRTAASRMSELIRSHRRQS